MALGKGKSGKPMKEEAAAAYGVCGDGPGSARPLGRFAMVPQAHTEVVGETASNSGVLLFSCVVFAVVFCLVAGAWLGIAGTFGGGCACKRGAGCDPCVHVGAHRAAVGARGGVAPR